MNTPTLRLTRLLSSSALILVSTAVAASAAIVSHWKFDETSGPTAFDSAGISEGTLSGGATFSGSGVSGGAISLDSVIPGSFVNMGTSFPGFTVGSFTISMWINTTATGEVVALSKHEAGTFNGYLMVVNSGAGYGVQDKAWFYGSNPAGSEANSTTTVNDGVWHHLVGVYQSGVSISIFVDGAPVESVQTAYTINSNSAPFLIGGFNIGGSPAAAYTGLVDDVQIYDNTLNDTEVNFLYLNPGQTVPEPSSSATLAGLGALTLFARRRRHAKEAPAGGGGGHDHGMGGMM